MRDREFGQTRFKVRSHRKKKQKGLPRTRNPIKRPAREREGAQLPFICRVISVVAVTCFVSSTPDKTMARALTDVIY